MVGCMKIKTNFTLRWVKLLLFLLYPAMMTASKTEKFDAVAELSLKKRNMLVNILISKLFAYIRHVITQGSPFAGIPILDPLEIEVFNLVIPTGLFSLDLRFKNISAIGLGGFVLHRNTLHLSNLTFEIEISIPRVVISAEAMHINEIDNDFMSAVPIMYNKDRTDLEIDNFRIQANLQLKQSDDERSILIDKIENAFFDVPSIKINSDAFVDTEDFEMFPELKEGLVKYVRNSKDALIKFVTNAILTFGNPILNRFDTWRYIGVLI